MYYRYEVIAANIYLPSTFWKLEYDVLVQMVRSKLCSSVASMSIKHSVVTHLGTARHNQ